MTPTLTKVDFSEALANSDPRVRQAFWSSHAALVKLGIPHIVIGGLAVNAHGHHYSTRDVDYLIDAQDVFAGDAVIYHKSQIPISVGGVPIDYVPSNDTYPELVRREMREELEAARTRTDKTGIAADWLLVWMKLNVGRSRDVAGIEGMIRVGLDVASVSEALAEVGDARVIESFERCVRRAEEE